MILTGKSFRPTKAKRAGLVDMVVDPLGRLQNIYIYIYIKSLFVHLQCFIIALSIENILFPTQLDF